MINRRTLLTASAASAATTLSGCSGSSQPPGLLRVATSNAPDSLDPARGQFASAALIYKQIHAGLTDYGRDGQLAPGLAQSWSVSEDGLVWTFILRDGLYWSDGRNLTAEDVVWSARRLVNPDESFADLGDFFAIKNAHAVLAGDMPPETFGVAALDERTVEFRLNTPLGLFPVLMREFYPFPRHVIEVHGSDWIRPENIVTAGAYTVTAQTQNGISLLRNVYYHGFENVLIPEIQIDTVRDASTRMRLYRAGEYDLADAPPTNQIAFLQDRLGEDFRSFDAPILRYLKLNHARPWLSDVRIRQALSLAIDRDFINREFFSGTGRLASKVIPGHIAAGLPGGQVDPDRALTLLNEAGFDPASYTFQIRTTIGEGERIALAVADDWSKIGIQTEQFSSYPTDLYQSVDAGDFDIAIASYNRGLKSDPFFMLDPFEAGGFADNFNWNDEQFSALMREARRISDPAERVNVYALAEGHLLEQAAIIPLLHERAHWLVAPRVQGTRHDVQPMLWRDLSLI